mgnify:CR=1 FL=1
MCPNPSHVCTTDLPAAAADTVAVAAVKDTRPAQAAAAPTATGARTLWAPDVTTEAVWELLHAVVPRCPNLRGITLERMEGTVTEADVVPLTEELQRLRAVVEIGKFHGMICPTTPRGS